MRIYHPENTFHYAEKLEIKQYRVSAKTPYIFLQKSHLIKWDIDIINVK